MAMADPTLRWGTIVGVWRGLVLFVINDYGTSIFLNNSLSHLLVPAVLCGIMVVIPFLVATIRHPYIIGKIYLISVAYYLAAFFLVFLNDLLFQINVFPQREIWYGDIMLHVFMMVVFVVIAGFMHLLSFIACVFFRPKTD